MGTSATIAVVKSDGKVIQTSVHYDGYLYEVGKILLEEYTNQDRVQLLVSLGEISSLGRFITPVIAFTDHSYNNPIEGVTVYYGRDRGETGTEPEEFCSFAQFIEDRQMEEYNYLFNEGKWVYSEMGSGEWKSLTQEAIAEEE